MSATTIRNSDENARGRSLPRTVLLFLLLGLGAIVLFGQPLVVNAVRDGRLPAESLFAAPGLIFLLAVLLGFDTARGAKARGFAGGRALVQLTVVVVFFALVANGTWREYRARKGPDGHTAGALSALMSSRDARVRALVMEVAGYRTNDEAELGALLEAGLDDADPLVREAAVEAVGRRFKVALEGEPGRERARTLLEGSRAEGTP